MSNPKSPTIIIDGIEYAPKSDSPPQPSGDYVLVRCRDAGVHAGHLMSVDGRTVRLERAVRIWRWRGARTLSEVSRDGVQSAAESGYTRVSAEVATITLLEACEVIPCTDAARLSIVTAGWAE